MRTSAAMGGASSAIAKNSGWFIVLGAVLILLGTIAWIDVAAATIASTIVIGAVLVVGGVFRILQSFMMKDWRGFIFGLLSGVLYLIGGLLVVNEPEHGAIVLTLLLAAIVIVGGIVRIILALQHKQFGAWGLILVSGFVSVVVGAVLYAKLPWSGIWILGTLIAIELLVQGAGWLYFGIALRFARSVAQ